MDLNQALVIVRAAGYRVSKLKPKKQSRVGPTCVVTFTDGQRVRMTTHCSDEAPDFDRGIKLAQTALESRWRGRCRQLLRRELYKKFKDDEDGLRFAIYEELTKLEMPPLPQCAAVHFERNGTRIV